MGGDIRRLTATETENLTQAHQCQQKGQHGEGQMSFWEAVVLWSQDSTRTGFQTKVPKDDGEMFERERGTPFSARNF